MTVRHDRPAPGAHLHQKAWERSLGGPPEARSISPPPPPGVPRSVLNLPRRPSICPQSAPASRNLPLDLPLRPLIRPRIRTRVLGSVLESATSSLDPSNSPEIEG